MTSNGGSNGGGGGGGSPTYVVPATPATVCKAGDLFDVSTGKSCPAIPATVCHPGDLFSQTNGLPCPTTPVVTPNTNTIGLCLATQILTQNLRAPSRNGVYNSYTKGIVKEAKILQAHMNRLGFVSGPEDGIIGPLTDGAIKRMQIFLHTKPDGLIGPITRGLINHSCGSAGLQQ